MIIHRGVFETGDSVIISFLFDITYIVLSLYNKKIDKLFKIIKKNFFLSVLEFQFCVFEKKPVNQFLNQFNYF
jgi:hypothetical protein